ncbi:MAG: carboxypeptidase regulatory-like domain-containing protein [Planctomycetes bacterium]|nr:carboxypeptidase regulatory-like domain-containing protein [Planctomycetota bacterium]
MLRPWFLFALACATSAPAQAPAPCLVELRDASGARVADAEGLLACEPPMSLPALAEFTRQERRVLQATSGADGRLRFVAADATPMLAGSGLVRTHAGSGALLERLRPGRVPRLTLQPLGAVALDATADADEPFTVFARALLPGGGLVALPPLAAQPPHGVRLPAGVYEVWIARRAGWSWQRIEVRSGQVTQLVADGPGQVLQLHADATLFPFRRPDLDLTRNGRTVQLLASALASTYVTWAGERCLPIGALPGPSRPDVLPWPPVAEPPPRVRLASHGLETGTRVYSLQRSAGGDWLPLAAVRVANDACELPAPPPGDTWLLAVGPDLPPFAIAWSHSVQPELRRPVGVPLAVTARDESGEFVVDLAVEYVPHAMDPAAVRGHTDAIGQARLGLAVGPGILRISDDRFANQDVALDTIPAEPLPLVVRAGVALRGTARWPDGKPAAGVVVTLRDPTGTLRPVARAVLAEADGSFTFTGLPERGGVVLFATTQHLGHTWTARAQVRLDDAGDCRLELRDEDPRLEPGR